MLAELRDDNKQLVASLRETHAICDKYDDVASASLIETWIDEAERRTWFLFEPTRFPGTENSNVTVALEEGVAG
jgi:starvation-inducible DNA-binding protein